MKQLSKLIKIELSAKEMEYKGRPEERGRGRGLAVGIFAGAHRYLGGSRRSWDGVGVGVKVFAPQSLFRHS